MVLGEKGCFDSGQLRVVSVLETCRAIEMLILKSFPPKMLLRTDFVFAKLALNRKLTGVCMV